MDFSLIDWSIIIIVLAFVTCAALTTRKYTKSVADFISANRCASRYILAIAEGEAGMGAISIIYLFELYLRTGFTKMFWDGLAIPLTMALSLSGFAVYRFRATRALTLAQFLEMRYSRKFRLFAGILCWVAGMVNFGIFPAVGARFFIHYLGFQEQFIDIGFCSVNVTLALTMGALLSLALFFTFIGGQIAILVTDFWQGLFSVLVFFALIICLMIYFPWKQMSEAFVIASEPGKSLINPFDIGDKKDFGFSYFGLMFFFMVYSRMSWQGQQGYRSAALTPHEARMGGIAGEIRSMLNLVGPVIIPFVAVVLYYHPDYIDQITGIRAQLQSAFPGDETLQRQMIVPVLLKNLLPVGLLGAFAAAMLGFFISTNNTYMHSWGTIFVQDVFCVIRRKPLTREQHMWLLRISILLVALFAFIFSLLYKQDDYIFMFMQISGAIFMAGAGTVVIGGLYWKRGNAAGAWTAMMVGATVAFSTIILRAFWKDIPFLVEMWGGEFPINSLKMAFVAAIMSITSYVIVSLLTSNPKVNMDRLLHRGKYTIAKEEEALKEQGAEQRLVPWYWRLIGVNSHEFSKADRFLCLYVVVYSIWRVGAFLVPTIIFVFGYMTRQYWVDIWQIFFYGALCFTFFGVSWITIGGVFDIRKLYKRLAVAQRDELDDGRVAGNHLLADNLEENAE